MEEEAKKAIEGKVANILNKRELVMNVGRKDGVKEKMRFKVVCSVPVKDPDTGEELGEVNREKIRVEVFQVEERFSLARTYETYQVNVGGDGISLEPTTELRRMLEPKKIITKVKTFDDASEFGAMDNSQSPIKVGDRVIQIFDEPKEMQLGQKESWISNKKAEVDAAEEEPLDVPTYLRFGKPKKRKK